MRDQELILRFFALLSNEQAYKRPMKSFLNDFMNEKRNLAHSECLAFTSAFENAISLVHDHIGTKAFKPVSSFNAAVFDAILIAISRRMEKAPLKDFVAFGVTYQRVMGSKEFSFWTSRSTADDETVKKRLKYATDEFAMVP